MAMTGPGRGERIAAINVTPMADVMIVLLIIFMVTTPLISGGRVRAPPFAGSAAPIGEGPLTVSIGTDAVPYLGDIPVPGPRDLEEHLRGALAGTGGDPVVYVKAEGGLPYGVITRVLDQCREAGARRIALIAGGRPPIDRYPGDLASRKP